MTTNRELIVPADPMSVEDQLAQLRRWIEGFVDTEGKRHPGLIETVGELYEELKLRRERREKLGRALASGGILAALGFTLDWLKNHVKF